MSDEPSRAESFERLLAWSYRGEVAGEVLFARLAVAFGDTGHRELFEVLADLERLMADALRPELLEHGVDGGDDERSRARGEADAAAAVDGGWDAFLPLFQSGTDHALGKYAALVQASGQPDAEIWNLLMAHERAIQAVGRLLDGTDRGDATAPVREVIGRLRAHIAR